MPGPQELLVIAVVALLVFGPDRLPEVARNAAKLLNRLRSEIEQQRRRAQACRGGRRARQGVARGQRRTARGRATSYASPCPRSVTSASTGGRPPSPCTARTTSRHPSTPRRRSGAEPQPHHAADPRDRPRLRRARAHRCRRPVGPSRPRRVGTSARTTRRPDHRRGHGPRVHLRAGRYRDDVVRRRPSTGCARQCARRYSGWIVAQSLKPTLDRPRPYQVDAAERLVAVPAGSSWPSGHSAVAAATATSLSRHLGPVSRVLSPGFVGTVAVSRLYVGVHHLTDVLAGVAVGHLCARAVRGARRAVWGPRSRTRRT